jgi:hypothetical protein
MAEGVGFEPTFAFAKTVFKTVAIVHSATPPKTVLVYEIDLSLATIRGCPGATAMEWGGEFRG